MCCRPRLPRPTRLCHRHRNLQRSQLLRALEKRHQQALRQVPGNVAVEGPGTGVVGVKLHDHVAVGCEVVRVAALWVCGVCNGGAVPGAGAVVEDVHVMAVEVHGLVVVRFPFLFLLREGSGMDV